MNACTWCFFINIIFFRPSVSIGFSRTAAFKTNPSAHTPVLFVQADFKSIPTLPLYTHIYFIHICVCVRRRALAGQRDGSGGGEIINYAPTRYSLSIPTYVLIIIRIRYSSVRYRTRGPASGPESIYAHARRLVMCAFGTNHSIAAHTSLTTHTHKPIPRF